jgi:c-di-GMP-binding flagellar brake protein YcgR
LGRADFCFLSSWLKEEMDMGVMEMVELWTNQLLEVECEDGSKYTTQIVKIEHDEIYIQRPVSKHQESMPLLHGNGSCVSVYFYNDKKEPYMFDTVLTVKNGKLVLTKPLPDGIKKVQRRNYFRVPARVEIEIHQPSGGIHKFVTEDLSGGGASFICPAPDLFHMNEEVTGVIRLEAKSEIINIPFIGKIANAKNILSGGRIFGVSITDIKEKHRSEIIRYCIRRQCEIRNKLKN